MSEYYKSLISDDEVIKELIKESKKREGKLPTEATRLKPNLNFFQRTVSSLVSTNTRIDKSQDSFKTEYRKDNVENPETSDNSPKHSSKKADVDYAFEREMVLQTKINFVQSSEAFGSSLGSRVKKKIEIKKISFGSKAAVASSLGIGTTTVANSKHSNKNIINQKLGSISSNSGDTSSEDLIFLLGNEKTTCKSVSIKHDKLNSKNKSKLDTDDVICISSDDDSLEILSSSAEDNEIKNNKMKTKVKKRKKKPTDHSDEESRQKTKRKKHKKKKKQH